MAAGIEDVHRHIEAAADLLQQPGGRYEDVLVVELGLRRTAYSQCAERPNDGEAGGVRLDEERGRPQYLLAAFLHHGLRKRCDHAGAMPEPDPDLVTRNTAPVAC